MSEQVQANEALKHDMDKVAERLRIATDEVALDLGGEGLVAKIAPLHEQGQDDLLPGLRAVTSLEQEYPGAQNRTTTRASELQTKAHQDEHDAIRAHARRHIRAQYRAGVASGLRSVLSFGLRK